MPLDFNPEERIVVYPYFTDTLLDLMRADPDFPPEELKKVLRYVGEAIHTSSMPNAGFILVRSLRLGNWYVKPSDHSSF